MAELVLKIGDRSDRPDDYKDGDILCAFSDRRIRCVHTENICHPRKAQRNASNLIIASTIARDWFERTHEFRFERVSATEIRRVVIATGAEEIIGPTPNKAGEAMDVRLFLARRKKHPTHRIFGEDGAEFWYGGRIDVTDAKLSAVWDAIEGKTPLRRNAAAFTKWPAGEQELKSHLFIPSDNFDDATAEELIAPELSDPDAKGEQIVVQRRLHRIDWKAKLSLAPADIARVQDTAQTIDLRDVTQYTSAAIVDRKPSAKTIDERTRS